MLGPLLFLVRVNDIAENLESSARPFQDDCSLAVTNINNDIIETKLNSDLQTIFQWS